MKKLSGKFNYLKRMSKGQIQRWAQELINILKQTIKQESIYIEKYINQLKKLKPGISNDELAKEIIFRSSLKAGGIGAVCGLGGVITLPITMPTDLYYCFKIQARMVLAIAYVYGWDIHDPDMITDILLVLEGSASINALKKAGINIAQEFAKKSISKSITREVMKKINKILSRKIITKAGEKSFTSFLKLAPIVGAPVGAAFDYASTWCIGKVALRFYGK